MYYCLKERLNLILIILNITSGTIFKYYKIVWKGKSSDRVLSSSMFASMNVSSRCPQVEKIEECWALYCPSYTCYCYLNYNLKLTLICHSFHR